MARFMVKASEYKNVCKAVNDRKLAELKKEIIEILKKQDEKEFKKAIDYLNSQELYYTHLEKSIMTGKWVEKAGYGIGTVRTWKGKKYKKVAQGKWVRVFDKEGHGTNVAIGKLISKIQKCDNVEDLMALVMANKSRFVDENGVDLPILDKLRAAADIRNEKLSGESSSYTYGVGENTSRAKNEIFADKDKITKEEAELHKVARKFSQMPTGELNKRKAQLERWIDNKTKNKREHLNNTIWREKYQEELDAINDVLDKRGVKKTEKVAANKMPKEKKEPNIENNFSMFDTVEFNMPGEGTVKGKILEDLGDDYYKVQSPSGYTTNVFGKDIKLIEKRSSVPEEKKDPSDKTEDKNTKVPFGGVDNNDEGEGKEALAMADKINEVAEKGELKVGDATFKVDKEGKEWAVRTEIMNAIKCKDAIDNINKNFDKAAKKKLEEDLKEKLDKIKAKLPDVVKEGKLEENKELVEKRLKQYSGHQGTTIDEVISNHKKDVIKRLENHVKDDELFTQKNTDDIELLSDVKHQVELCSINTSAIFYKECKKLLEEAEKESKTEEKSTENGIDENTKKEALDRIKEYAGKKINSKPIEITKIEDDGVQSGFLTFEFKSGDDTYKMTYDYGFGGEKGGASIKKIESETKEKTDFDVEAYKKSKKKLEDTIADIDKKIQLYDSNPTPNGMRMAQQLENQKKEWQKQLDNLETQKKDYKKSVLGELILLEGIEEKKEDEEEFLLDNILEEDIDDMAKEKEEESLFNDYSAEESEEFNSTEFMVREALNRRFNCL